MTEAIKLYFIKPTAAKILAIVYLKDPLIIADISNRFITGNIVKYSSP